MRAARLTENRAGYEDRWFPGLKGETWGTRPLGEPTVAHPGFFLQSIVSAHLVSEREDYIDGGIHLDRFAKQKIGPVDPLLDRVQGGLLEHGWATDNVQVFNAAFHADPGLQNNGSLHSNLLRDGRIVRIDPLDEKPLGHTARNGDEFHLLRGRVGGREKDGFVDGG